MNECIIKVNDTSPGKTRTKDKYRVVYSDFQRLELEKEFCYNKFISIRRKSEIATMLNLSDRQVKIWFQNRRAKERRQKKEFDTITTTPLVTDTTEDCQNTFLEQSSYLLPPHQLRSSVKVPQQLPILAFF
ncbi:homeobox protein CDX [Mytilus galloprovincialis]|uniref:Homeobox protein CDX n=1 Tax=Mytilus galloprovincialis TaxID=29158 RepID=A0A8B6GE93_MYTGA|nr:homeobox protein CDX [Mytilus galloprovincialis]